MKQSEARAIELLEQCEDLTDTIQCDVNSLRELIEELIDAHEKQLGQDMVDTLEDYLSNCDEVYYNVGDIYSTINEFKNELEEKIKNRRKAEVKSKLV